MFPVRARESRRPDVSVVRVQAHRHPDTIAFRLGRSTPGAPSQASRWMFRIRPYAYTQPASARSDSSMKPIEYESFAL